MVAKDCQGVMTRGGPTERSHDVTIWSERLITAPHTDRNLNYRL